MDHHSKIQLTMISNLSLDFQDFFGKWLYNVDPPPSCPVWPDAEVKSGPIFQKLPQFLSQKGRFSKQPKSHCKCGVHTFETKYFTQNFRKSPNLVTRLLPPGSQSKKFLILLPPLRVENQNQIEVFLAKINLAFVSKCPLCELETFRLLTF